MALRLDNGLPDANTENNSRTTNERWVGVSADADSSVNSTMLTAKATLSEVVIVSLGNCVGGWFKPEAHACTIAG